MHIQVVEVADIPTLQPDGSMANESFVTLRFFHNNEPHGQVKVHTADLDIEVAEGDELKLVKA